MEGCGYRLVWVSHRTVEGWGSRPVWVRRGTVDGWGSRLVWVSHGTVEGWGSRLVWARRGTVDKRVFFAEERVLGATRTVKVGGAVGGDILVSNISIGH